MSEQQAGWYPDPAGDTSKLRYWDGTSWTSNFTDVQASSSTVQPVQPVVTVEPVQATVQPVQAQTVGSGSTYGYSPTPTNPVYMQPPTSTTNGLAVAALICGIAGFCTGGLTSIVAIILGIMARKKPAQQGVAIAGLITGIASLILYILIYLLMGVAFLSVLSLGY